MVEVATLLNSKELANHASRGGVGGERGRVRFGLLPVMLVLVLTQIPVVSAHGGEGIVAMSQGTSVLVIIAGIGVTAGSALLKRYEQLSPTTALYGILAGLTIAVIGTMIFDGVTPDPTYTASSMPFPRSWYEPLGLGFGLGISIGSFVIGWLRWPTRPRYTFLGITMGLWISYPYLLRGPTSYTHPLGYLLVLGTPLLVAYILWTDAGDILKSAVRDTVARRFGGAISLLSFLFFFTTSGYLSFFWEEGVPRKQVFTVLPVNYQLVQWDTLEVILPEIPLTLALSVGVIIINGLLSALIGLNALLIAQQWRLEEAAGTAQGTAGTGSVLGACTCGCCGPLIAKIAVLAAGPSVAAPLYWIFVDSSSPFSVLFIVAAILIFTGTLIHSVADARPTPA